VQVGSDPTDIAFNSTGTIAYVTNQFSSTVGVVDVNSGVTTDNIAVSGAPFRVIVAPNNTQIIVSSNNDSVYAIGGRLENCVASLGVRRPGQRNGPDVERDGALRVEHRRKTLQAEPEWDGAGR